MGRMTGTSTAADAIARHEAVQAAYDAAAAASAASPDDMNADDIAGELCKAESDAYDVLVAVPCDSDAEFLEKLEYLNKREAQFGSPFESRADFVSVARAAALHFGAMSDT